MTFIALAFAIIIIVGTTAAAVYDAIDRRLQR